jgi:hypothetical protein
MPPRFPYSGRRVVMLLVQDVTGPSHAQVGETVTYRVASFNRPSPSVADRARVSWLIKSEDGGALAHFPSHGAALDMSVPERWVNHTAIVMPYLRSPTTAIAARTAITAGNYRTHRATTHQVEVSREDGRFYASVDGEPRFYLGTQVRYAARRGLMNLANAPGPRYRPEDFERQHGDWAWYLLPTITCESKGYFTCLNTYDRACFTFGHMQLGAHTPDDNFVLFFRQLLQQPSAPSYFPDLTVIDGRIHRLTNAGPQPLETAVDTSGLMSYFNQTADQVDPDEAARAARVVDWSLRDQSARDLQVSFAVTEQRRKLSTHAQRLPLDGRVDKLCLVVLDILHQGRASYRLIESALAADNPFDALLSLGAATYRERIATLRAAIRDLEEIGKVGQKVYDVLTGDFVPPVGA